MGGGAVVKRYEYTLVFLIGGTGYGLCELLWRGYTHPTMFLLGGVCFLCLYAGNKRYFSLPFAVRCICGGVVITSLELVTGYVVNILLGMNVWDYSDMPLNLYGQVCPRFLLAWMLLCVPALFLCTRLALFFGYADMKKSP